MIRKTGEAYHHERKQIIEYARDTVTIADEAGLIGEDRAALLPAIFNARQSKQVVMEQTEMRGALAIPRNSR